MPAQQIGVHEALRCVLLVFYLCSRSRNIVFQPKINFSVVCFPCVWLYFICVSFKFKWIHVCLLWDYEHMVNSKWFQMSTSWTQKDPEHTLAPISWPLRSWLAARS